MFGISPCVFVCVTYGVGVPPERERDTELGQGEGYLWHLSLSLYLIHIFNPINTPLISFSQYSFLSVHPPTPTPLTMSIFLSAFSLISAVITKHSGPSICHILSTCALSLHI